MKHQRGQSMVEFAIGASVLSLVMLGTVTLSGYLEIQRRAIASARQIAYEVMWYGGRVQADPSRLHAAEFADAGAAEPLTGHTYVGQGDLTVRATWGEADGAAANASRLILSPLRLAGWFSGPGFDLQNNGLLRSQVDVRIAPIDGLPMPFSAMDLAMSESYTVLTDPWQASGPDHVQRRTSGLVPGARLSTLSGLWRALLTPVRLLDPSVGQLCLGIVEPERIPEDRLGQGVTPAVNSCP